MGSGHQESNCVVGNYFCPLPFMSSLLKFSGLEQQGKQPDIMVPLYPYLAAFILGDDMKQIQIELSNIIRDLDFFENKLIDIRRTMSKHRARIAAITKQFVRHNDTLPKACHYCGKVFSHGIQGTFDFARHFDTCTYSEITNA